MNNKTYLFGWSGFLGYEIVTKLSNQEHQFIKVGRSQKSDIKLDLGYPDFEFVSQMGSGDKFIFLAAISSPDFCSDNYQMANLVNVINSIELIKILLDKGVNVLFASSDVVYGKTDLPVNELSSINPTFAYAEMKAKVENTFQDHTNFFVMRLSYISSVRDSFTSYLIRCSKENKNVDVFDPFIRSIITSQDVVCYIEMFIKNKHYVKNLVNLVGNNFISRLEYVNRFSKNLPLKFNKVTPPKTFFNKRPNVIMVESLYLSKCLKRKPLDVLDELSKELEKN